MNINDFTFTTLDEIEDHLRNGITDMTNGTISLHHIAICRQEIGNIQWFYRTLDSILKELEKEYENIK